MAIILLGLLTLVIISLQKTYNHVAVKELKRRARAGDRLAESLYRVATYGLNLDILLWLVLGLSASGFFVLLARRVPVWESITISALVLWLGFAWLPNTRVSIVGEYLARICSLPLGWALAKLHPFLERISSLVKGRAELGAHTGLYQKEDIIELLKNQRKQLDNRITKDEIRIATGALEYADKLVRDVMTPRRVAKMVASTELVGPVLMSELHDSGHSRFPVFEGKKDNIVGVLALHDVLEANEKVKVSSLMNKSVHYAHEEQSLGELLPAFLKTHYHLFVVVNSFEEIVGIITIEDVIEQIIGKPIVDEFDQYEDLRAVAKKDAEEEIEEHKKDTEVVK